MMVMVATLVSNGVLLLMRFDLVFKRGVQQFRFLNMLLCCYVSSVPRGCGLLCAGHRVIRVVRLGALA